MEENFVPLPKFNEMVEAVACNTISETDTVMHTVFFKQKEYVITSSMSSGAQGYICVWGHEAIELSKYTGKLKPMRGPAHYKDVNAGNRERGYEGHLVNHGERKLVLTGEQITFTATDEGKQESLF